MQQLSLLGRTHVPRFCWLNFKNPIRSNLIQLLEFAWTNIHLPMSNQDHIPESKSKKLIDIKVCGHKPIFFCIFMIGLHRSTIDPIYYHSKVSECSSPPVSEKVIFVVVTSCHIAIALVSATCSQLQIKKRKKKQDIHANDPHFGWFIKLPDENLTKFDKNLFISKICFSWWPSRQEWK